MIGSPLEIVFSLSLIIVIFAGYLTFDSNSQDLSINKEYILKTTNYLMDKEYNSYPIFLNNNDILKQINININCLSKCKDNSLLKNNNQNIIITKEANYKTIYYYINEELTIFKEPMNYIYYYFYIADTLKISSVDINVHKANIDNITEKCLTEENILNNKKQKCIYVLVMKKTTTKL